MPSVHALHLIERLSAVLRSEVRAAAAADGLEPVHVVALWYLSRANIFRPREMAPVGSFESFSPLPKVFGGEAMYCR